MERGREQPPGSAPTAVPRPARRVAHARVPVSQTTAETLEDLPRFANAFFVAYSSQIGHGMQFALGADFYSCTVASAIT
jgi:hypothetical protein